jgi:hypothetical protein
MNALSIGTAVTLELRFNPVDGCAVAVGSLAAVSKIGYAADRRFIALQVEPRNQGPDRIVIGGGLAAGARQQQESGGACRK